MLSAEATIHLTAAAEIDFQMLMEGYPHKDTLPPSLLALAHGFFVQGYVRGATDMASMHTWVGGSDA